MENSIFANMEEIWKDIPGYEDWYQVSNLGNVRSVDRYVNSRWGKIYRKGRPLSPNKVDTGYMHIMLCKNQTNKTFRLHRLVWESFNGKIPDGMQINHIDEDKTNNRLDNLNLMTPKENVNYGTCLERRSKTNTNGKKSKPVLQYTLDGELVAEYPSLMECKRNGFDLSSVSACCRGKYKQYKGFIWKFKNVAPTL